MSAQGETLEGSHVKDNTLIREVDGVSIDTPSGVSAKVIDVPGNKRSDLGNEFEEEPWSLDDLLDGDGGSTH